MRIKTRWNQREREHSLEETASALGFITWRIGMNALLNLENEGFQTDTQAQRMEVIAEFIAFLVHATDRLVYGGMSEEDRAAFINAYAGKLSGHWQDNARDILGPGDHRTPFIDLLNRRMDDYADFSFPDGEPGYALARYLGDRVTAAMGPRDRKWISDQVMDVEVPEAMKTLKKGLRGLLPEQREAAG